MATATQIKITKSDDDMQAQLDRISARIEAARLDKIAADAATRAARLAQIAAMPATTCTCTTETIENSWAPCRCDDNATSWN